MLDANSAHILAADVRLLWDRFDLFLECEALVHDLAVLEYQHGPHADFEDARRRTLQGTRRRARAVARALKFADRDRRPLMTGARDVSRLRRRCEACRRRAWFVLTLQRDRTSRRCWRCWFRELCSTAAT